MSAQDAKEKLLKLLNLIEDLDIGEVRNERIRKGFVSLLSAYHVKPSDLEESNLIEFTCQGTIYAGDKIEENERYVTVILKVHKTKPENYENVFETIGIPSFKKTN